MPDTPRPLTEQEQAEAGELVALLVTGNGQGRMAKLAAIEALVRRCGDAEAAAKAGGADYCKTCERWPTRVADEHGPNACWMCEGCGIRYYTWADMGRHDVALWQARAEKAEAARDEARRLAVEWRDYSATLDAEPPSPDYLLPWERPERMSRDDDKEGT